MRSSADKIRCIAHWFSWFPTLCTHIYIEVWVPQPKRYHSETRTGQKTRLIIQYIWKKKTNEYINKRKIISFLSLSWLSSFIYICELLMTRTNKRGDYIFHNWWEDTEIRKHSFLLVLCLQCLFDRSIFSFLQLTITNHLNDLGISRTSGTREKQILDPFNTPTTNRWHAKQQFSKTSHIITMNFFTIRCQWHANFFT